MAASILAFPRRGTEEPLSPPGPPLKAIDITRIIGAWHELSDSGREAFWILATSDSPAAIRALSSVAVREAVMFMTKFNALEAGVFRERYL